MEFSPFSEDWDEEEFSEYLKLNRLHEDVVSAIADNCVNSKLFLSLTETDFKEVLHLLVIEFV